MNKIFTEIKESAIIILIAKVACEEFIERSVDF